MAEPASRPSPSPSPSLAVDMSGAAPQQGQHPPDEGGDGGLAESLAAVRSRARRGKRGEPESGQQAVVSLLKEDRLRRLESRFQEDREARLRLEVTVEAQQRTIKALEQQLQFAQSEGREAQRIAARSAPPAGSARRQLELEDGIRAAEEENRQLAKRVAHLEKQHSVVELAARMGLLEAAMVTPAHVAEQVMGLFERNYAPLLGHLTDIVEELQERVDCLEDAAPPDEGLAGGGLAHLVKEEVARLVARVRCLLRLLHCLRVWPIS